MRKNKECSWPGRRGFMELPHLVCLQLMPQLGQLASSGEVCKEIVFDFLRILLIIILAFC